MPDPLLRNKLYLPPRRATLVPRPTLHARLDHVLHPGYKLALISAPAGFGKTTLVSEWIHRGDAGGMDPPLQVAWLSLDEGDNDPARFWRYVVAALRTFPALDGALVGEALLAQLEEQGPLSLAGPLSTPAPLHALLADLLNALETRLGGLSEPAVLVLDDLHTVREPQIHDALAYLLEHLTERLRLVVCTRADPPWPLARARARQALVELRARELRLGGDQVAALLNEVHGLDLRPTEIETLNARTEGWVAGLQMAALAMHASATQAHAPGERADQAAFVEAFSGSQRFVLDYLIEEVLDRQPDGVQAFLLQTSILERMCAPLCDAVRADSALESAAEPKLGSQALLERLERDNLFVVPLDGERRWYRYHGLFADLLRHRVEADPARAQAVHRAASGWFEAEGLFSEAISHALAAGDDERAAALIEAQVPGVLERGETSRIRRFLDALSGPLLRASPLLCLARAWTLHGYAPPETVEQWLCDAETAIEGAAPLDAELLHTVQGSIAVLRVFSARTGEAPLETQLALLRQAERVVPESDLAMRADVMAMLGLCQMDAGDEPAAERAFVEAYRLGLAGGGLWAALVAVYARTIVARWHGDLPRAAALCREALDALDRAQGSPQRSRYQADLQILLGRVLLEWNDLEGAEHCLSEGLDGRAPGGVTEIVLKGRFARARLDLARGKVGEVPALGGLVPAYVRGLAAYAAALEAHLCLMYAARAPGHPQAPAWQQRAADWAVAQALDADGEHWPTVARLVAARVRIAEYRAGRISPSSEGLEPVLAYLDAQAARLEARDWVELQVETWIVRAMALSALGREHAALAALERALRLAAPGGYKRLFLDEGAPMAQLLARAAEGGVAAAGPLLAASAPPPESPGATAVLALLDPLSARELDVLRQMAGDRSQPEIAQALYISVNTVRSHVKHIYDKLDVHSRHEAVERAQELGLL